MIWITLLAFVACWLTCRLIVRKAVAWRLVDVPNDRSSHVIPTPRGGGIGIVLGFVAGCVLLVVAGMPTVEPVLLAAALVLAVAGFADDRFSLGVLPRFVLQIACAAVVVGLADMFTSSLYWLNLLLMGAAVVYLVWLTNLYNFMDGIDGIAAVEAMSVTASVAIISFLNTGSVETPAWIVLAASCAGFLCWNWSPARLFMGDVGSTFLGFVLGVWSLLSSVPLVCWLILLAVFIADASVTLLLRLCRGERVFQAHRSHLYQRLAVRWASHRKVCLLMLLVNVLWLLPLAFVANRWAESRVFTGLLLVVAYLPIVLIVYNMTKVDGCCVGKNSIKSTVTE